MAITSFTREDVVQHLAELGYNNVDEGKLDSFCADLKRLIKYEEKKRLVNEKLLKLEESRRKLTESSSTTSIEVPKRRRRIRKDEKRRLKEEKLIKLRQMDSTDSARVSVIDDFELSSSVEVKDDVDCDSKLLSRGFSNSVDEEQSSLYIDVNLPSSNPQTCQPLASSLLKEPASGFIRVRSGPSMGRKGPASDPVALHQRYKEHWSRVNIPGERKHSKLRWAVREWMMGEEPI